MIQDSLNVAIVQVNIQPEDATTNLQHYNNLMQQVPQNTQLVVLPEMFSTGFSMNVKLAAEPMNGASVCWLCETAKRHNFAITTSIMIEDDGKYYNRGFFVYPDGTYKHFNKRHLFSYGGENKYYTAGTERLIVEYMGWRILPLICYDLRFPVWSRNQNNYDLLIYVASWPNARQNVWSLLPVARALENQCYVLAANRVGKDSSGTYTGESKVISPKGDTISVAEDYKEQVVCGVLSLSELQRFREKFNVSADADRFTIYV